MVIKLHFLIQTISVSLPNDVTLCHFLVLDPHLKALCPTYTSQSIGLLHSVGPSPLDPEREGIIIYVHTSHSFYIKAQK